MVNKKLKRVNEKSVLFAVFILLAILALGSLFIVKPKMTGFVIVQPGYNATSCGEGGYVWHEGVCYDGQPVCDTGFLELCLDETNCTGVGYWYDGECNEDEVSSSEDMNSSCVSNWECGEWTACVEGTQTRECTDSNNCVAIEGKPVESQNCTITCIEDWTCDDWTACVDETQTRTCTDANACGTTESKPTESQDCTEDNNNNNNNNNDEVWGSSCVSNWECGEWTDCIDNTQTREECVDTNNCVTPTDLPTMSIPCISAEITSESPEILETCSDGIKNQDEKGIDCGGVCEQRCSFFTIMGNAVNVPINSSKQFVQNNKAISFSILGIIVLFVSWIFVAKFALKKQNIFFFVEEIKKKIKNKLNNQNS